MIRLLSAGLVLLATAAHADGAFYLCDIFAEAEEEVTPGRLLP